MIHQQRRGAVLLEVKLASWEQNRYRERGGRED